MSNLINLIQELKNLGFTKEQVEQTIKIAEDEIIDTIIEDFTLNADEQIVQHYVQKFANAKNNPQVLTHTLNEIIAIQYGKENVINKKEELLIKYLQETVTLTQQIKDTYIKYTQGDPEAIKFVEEAKQNPAIASFVQELEQNPQDKG